MGGENALPCFSPQHIDAAGLDRIVYNTQAWAAPLQVCFAVVDAVTQATFLVFKAAAVRLP